MELPVPLLWCVTFCWFPYFAYNIHVLTLRYPFFPYNSMVFGLSFGFLYLVWILDFSFWNTKLLIIREDSLFLLKITKKYFLFTSILNNWYFFQGLVVSNHKVQNKQLHLSSKLQESPDLSNFSLSVKESECISNTDEESCPVCHEKLCNPKMVFPCGHVLCCKCKCYIFLI